MPTTVRSGFQPKRRAKVVPGLKGVGKDRKVLRGDINTRDPASLQREIMWVLMAAKERLGLHIENIRGF
jgi:hypothetical protein